MAKITKLVEKAQQRFARHSEVDATYFITDEGYLQIDTYGSKQRQSEQKVSQSLQFTPEIMEQLIKIWGNRKV